MLSEEQIARYTHHLVLKDIGGAGQLKLLNARVLIVGVGGLGAPAAFYLAAAGVGTIGLCDDDNVEISNLQRQIIHGVKDLGKKKVESAAEKLVLQNSDVRIEKIAERLVSSNIRGIISSYDFVIDASDNFSTKFLINDACVAMQKPFSHAGVVGFGGQIFTFVPGSLCLRCVFPEAPSAEEARNCRGAGILGAAAGIVGSIQAAEAIKYIIEKGSLLSGRMLIFDALHMQFRVSSLARRDSCAVCGGESLKNIDTDL